jgi:hypothetical protein
LYGPLKIKFDWYDKINEPGVFGGFSFIESTLDFTAPNWHYVSLGSFEPGSNILVMTTENATVYLVPASTTKDSLSIVAAAISEENALAYKPVNLSTTDSTIGSFVVYAIDGSNNISEASKEIFLQYPVGSTKLANEKSFTLEYNHTSQRIKIHGIRPIKQVNIFSIGGKKIASSQHLSEDIEIETKHYIPGIYILHVVDNTGNLSIKKFSKTEIK